MSTKEVFCMTYKDHIVREGSPALLEWLLESDFFTAPASTKYHGAHEGGLAEHSLHVYNRLRQLCIAEYGKVEDMEPIAICGLLHDLCKTNFYAVSTRNVKNEKTGLWEKQPYYTVADMFPMGHGEKSVFLIERFMHLTPDEALAIRWHTLEVYYVLRYRNGYFCKWLKRGFLYTAYGDSASSRKFKTEKEAQRYLDKYKERLGCTELSIERMARNGLSEAEILPT